MLTASTFLSDIGVNTHVDATETPYGNIALTETALSYLGVSLIRDHAYDIDVPAYTALAGSGVRLDLISDGADPGAELGPIAPLAASVVSLEGANEVDLFPVEGATPGDEVQKALTEQSNLYAAAKADPVFAATPVLNESVGFPSNYAAYATAIGNSDVANIHAYASSLPPAAALALAVAVEDPIPGKPAEITETGYDTLPADQTGGVDEAVQAKYTLDTLFDAASLGVTATFLYELFDEAPDPAGTDPELDFGLFHVDGSPKPAATAIHNLTSILSGTGPAAPALTPSVSGLPASGQWLELHGAGGQSFIAVWAEPLIWDPITESEVAAPSETVTVNLGTSVPSVSVFDPLSGTTPIATGTNLSAVTLQITDHPLILALAGASPSSGGSSSGTSSSSTSSSGGGSSSGTATGSSPATDPSSPPSAPPTNDDATLPVFRFFDTAYGTQFLTGSAAEAATTIATRPDLVNEGVGLHSIDPASGDPNASPVYRFFDTANGTHFFTASAAERDTVIATRPDLSFEGVGFLEDTMPEPGDVPVYRFFESRQGTHFYTSDAGERATILATRPDLVPEGIGFYAPSS